MYMAPFSCCLCFLFYFHDKTFYFEVCVNGSFLGWLLWFVCLFGSHCACAILYWYVRVFYSPSHSFVDIDAFVMNPSFKLEWLLSVAMKQQQSGGLDGWGTLPNMVEGGINVFFHSNLC